MLDRLVSYNNLQIYFVFIRGMLYVFCYVNLNSYSEY